MKTPSSFGSISAKVLLLLLFSPSSQILAQSSLSESPLPKPTSPVMDYAGVLDDATKTRIEKLLLDFKSSTNPSVEIAVAIVKTTGDRPIFDYSLAVARGWGIGSREDDNPGALLFIAIDDRKYQTQISKDLEDELPDGIVGSIGRKMLVPQFRTGNYGKGIEDTLREYTDTIEIRSLDIAFTKTEDHEYDNADVSYLNKSDALVNDFYGILETPTKTVMNRYLEEFRDSTNPPVSIYLTIVDETDGIPIRSFAKAVAKKWNIDVSSENERIAFIVVAITDKKYTTLVSPALRQKLSPQYVKGVQKIHIERAFGPFSGEYNKEISKTVNKYVYAIDSSRAEVDFTKGNPDGFRGYDGIFHYILDNWMMIFFLILGIIFLLFVIKALFSGDSSSGGGSSGNGGSWHTDTSSSSSSGNWNSSGSSGDFGGFGGGGDFGGGGAGGSW